MVWESSSRVEGVGGFQSLCSFAYTAANGTKSNMLNMAIWMPMCLESQGNNGHHFRDFQFTSKEYILINRQETNLKVET